MKLWMYTNVYYIMCSKNTQVKVGVNAVCLYQK